MTSSGNASLRTVGWPVEAPEFRAMGTPWIAIEDAGRLAPFEKLSTAELGAWTDRLRRAGVVADRHNSPSLIGQLNQAIRRPVDTVLCSALDVDPAACLNSALAARFPLELAAGVLVIGRLSGAPRAAIIADARVPADWFALLRRAAGQRDIPLEPIINDYPQPDPTLMLYTLLERRLRPGRLPTEQGVVLLDAAAAVAVGRHALLDEPMQQSPMVVRDHALARSIYLTTPTGHTFGELLQRLELPAAGRILRTGDLLRDVRVPPEAMIGGGELVLYSSRPSPPVNPGPCIRCGWCVDSCPTRVQPAGVLEACQQDDIEQAERAGIEACIECGVCSYVCPSQLPLLEGIRTIRKKTKTQA